MAQHRDIIIIGGGLNGASLGLALAKHGVSSHIIDNGDRAAILDAAFDGRTTAIASTSMAMFEAIGLGDALAGKGCPIESIWVSDQLKPGELDFAPDAGEYLGHMYENRVLRTALFEAMDAEPLITLHMPASVAQQTIHAGGVSILLNTGEELTGQLLVAAEGRKSPTREAAGFKMAHWTYDQTGMVGAIYHEHPHNGCAYEIFYPDGPFALLPMNPDAGAPLPYRSAFVWSVPTAKAAAYGKLADRPFLIEMQKKMGEMMGDIALAAPRMAYPLAFQRTAKVTGERLVLLGDAAHGIHPIAGQGLNLGLRDVASLAEVIVDGMRKGLDPADPALLARYERWRALDVMAVAGGTDILTHFFGLPGKGISAIRRAGLAMVQRAKPAKNLFMGSARGTSGALPRLLAGQMI